MTAAMIKEDIEEIPREMVYKMHRYSENKPQKKKRHRRQEKAIGISGQ